MLSQKLCDIRGSVTFTMSWDICSLTPVAKFPTFLPCKCLGVAPPPLAETHLFCSPERDRIATSCRRRRASNQRERPQEEVTRGQEHRPHLPDTTHCQPTTPCLSRSNPAAAIQEESLCETMRVLGWSLRSQHCRGGEEILMSLLFVSELTL